MVLAGEPDGYFVPMTPLGRLRVVRRHPRAADAALAAVLYALTLLSTAASPLAWHDELNPPALLAAGLAYGALVWRRRWPFGALVVAMVGAEAFMSLTRGAEGVLAAPLIALYGLADAAGRRRSLLIGGLLVPGLAGLHGLLRPASLLGPENLALLVLGGLAVAAGDASHRRRAHLAEAQERAARAERDREQEALRRVAEERLRIARDLHDSMGHHISLINVQAGAAAWVFDDQPEQALQALVHIRQASGAALGELGETIGLLRRPDEPDAAAEPPVGLARLPELLASFGRAGLRVEHRVSGAARALPPAVDVAAYRVVEESLTNVRKHAGDAAVRVVLGYRPAELRVTVENDASPSGRHPGDGPRGGRRHGIVGMRERVTAIGGSVHAAPRPNGGFRVHAVLPLPGGAAR